MARIISQIIPTALALLLFIFNIFSCSGQILRDSVSINMLKDGISEIYNLRFKEADSVLKRLKDKYPQSPALTLYRGLTIYWQNYPILSSTASGNSFEDAMKECIRKCETNQAGNEDEYLLTGLCARGMLLMFYADNNLILKVFSLTNSTYPLIRKAFKISSTFTDFNFFTGLYDYYRQAYPEAHPVYKPLAILFPPGNKQKGLIELRHTAEKGLLLKAESAYFLSGIYQTYEKNQTEALNISRLLSYSYPSNIHYKAIFIKNLLISEFYKEAEKMIYSGGEANNYFYQAELTIFRGFLEEKKYDNYKMAVELNNKGIEKISVFGELGKEIQAFGWLGLSRISALENDFRSEKIYREKASKLADIKTIDFSHDNSNNELSQNKILK